jgi:hypothetical protein
VRGLLGRVEGAIGLGAAWASRFDARAARDRQGFRVSGWLRGERRGWVGRRGYASGGWAEACCGEAPFVSVGLGRGERELDAPCTDANKTGELEELEADRAAGGLSELGVGEADAPEGADLDVCWMTVNCETRR